MDLESFLAKDRDCWTLMMTRMNSTMLASSVLALEPNNMMIGIKPKKILLS
jgi:hypothetical protein